MDLSTIDQSVSTGFRPLSTRALRALELRDLNPVDTSWSAFNSLAPKFELRAQPLSVEIKMSPHMPNCTYNDFHVLTLPSAMGSDAVPRNLQRHLHTSLRIVILCRLGVFTSAIEEKMVKHGESRMQR